MAHFLKQSLDKKTSQVKFNWLAELFVVSLSEIPFAIYKKISSCYFYQKSSFIYHLKHFLTACLFKFCSACSLFCSSLFSLQNFIASFALSCIYFCIGSNHSSLKLNSACFLNSNLLSLSKPSKCLSHTKRFSCSLNPQ